MILGASVIVTTSPPSAAASASSACDPDRLGRVVGRRCPRRAIARDALADPGERAVRRDLVVEPAGAQVVDQLVELVVGDAVAVAVVHLQARRLGARRDALDVLER